MIHKQDLMLISNICEDISEDEYKVVENTFYTLNAVSRATNASLFVIDFYKNQIIYRSPYLIFADDATMKDMQRESVNPYWRLITENDLDKLLDARKEYLQLVKEFSLDEKLDHTYVINYNIMMNGKEFLISQKFSPLLLRADGSLWFGLFAISHSTFKEFGHITLYNNRMRLQYNMDKRKFEPFRIKLSVVERSIIYRISKGMSVKQIADDLCLAENTIKTHKRRMFEKLSVNSTEEALTLCSNLNLLSM